MGRYTEDSVREVKERTDLVQLVSETVVLQQRGRLFWGCCPFHDEATPSFKVDPDTQLWHCFGCGEGGDVFGFVMRRDGLDFLQAVEKLADLAHVELARGGEVARASGSRARTAAQLASRKGAEELYAVFAEAQQILSGNLREVAAAEPGMGSYDLRCSVQVELASRGLSFDEALDAGVGYAKGGTALADVLAAAGRTERELSESGLLRVVPGEGNFDALAGALTVPVRKSESHDGIVAFAAHPVGNDAMSHDLTLSATLPNRHFSPEMNLCGYAAARAAAKSMPEGKRRILVVHDPLDVVALQSRGHRNVVCPVGIGLDAGHVRNLARSAEDVMVAQGDKGFDAHFVASIGNVLSRMPFTAATRPFSLARFALPDGKSIGMLTEGQLGRALETREGVARIAPGKRVKQDSRARPRRPENTFTGQRTSGRER